MTLKNEFGFRMRYWRQKSCMTQDQLAAKLNVSQDTIYRYENGKTLKLDMQFCFEIYAALGVTADEFWGEMT